MRRREPAGFLTPMIDPRFLCPTQRLAHLLRDVTSKAWAAGCSRIVDIRTLLQRNLKDTLAKTTPIG